MITIKSRAHRTLGNFENYTTDTDECNRFISLVDKELYENEGELVGVYFNEVTQPFFSIGIFEKGLLVCDPDIEKNTSYKFARFKDIRSIKLPEHNITASNIMLTLETSEVIVLPILGGRGKFRDVFEFDRFLIRVLKDLEEKPQ